MKKTTQIISILIISLSALKAQPFLNKNDFLINGYAKKLSGPDYDYHSCIPGLRENMLLRTTSGKDFIEWETDTVHGNIRNKFPRYRWPCELNGPLLNILNAGLPAVEVDVNGAPVENPSAAIGPLESKFYRISFTP